LRQTTEILPWEHINIGVEKSFLLNEFILSKEKKTSIDCRQGCIACGIQTNFQIDCSKIRMDGNKEW